MGQEPNQSTQTKIKYHSPYRNEKTPSFFVFTKTNRWWDFGAKEGGDVVDLVKKYLDSQKASCEVSDALRWTKNMVSFIGISPVAVYDSYAEKSRADEKTLELKHTGPIKEKGLILYGKKRGITQSVLKQYFEQVHIFNKNTCKTFITLGMRNESNGYDLRNPIFKGCIGTKDITFIRGTIIKPSAIHVFEGAFDFVTLIEQRKGKPLENDAIILHSLNCMDKGSAFIRNYGYSKCYSWMDNDTAGLIAVKSWDDFCKLEENLQHVPMNAKYAPHNDVNAAHMFKLGL